MRDHDSMFNRILQEEDKEYVLMGVSPGHCESSRDLPHHPSPIRSWDVMPGHVARVATFGTRATAQEWISWSRTHDRQMRARILEWVLMDPWRGAELIKRISADADYRTKFGRCYTSISAVLVRLGVPEPQLLSPSWTR